ncbi:hypothetical protein L0Z72_14330 [candidate division KSB1 bacterium]|nr:hypothetical protein [candidate division KSB1 bacterium]
MRSEKVYSLMEFQDATIKWLLDSDPAIRWQTMRDLIGSNQAEIAAECQKIAREGWGAKLLARQDESGKWGGGIYSPKWISTTYTMMLLRDFGLPPTNGQAQQACQLLFDCGFYRDGGINYFKSFKHSETCVTGMILSLLAYFHYPDDRIHTLADHLLDQQMPDGGWNCQSYNGATHSSFHTTISVLEGLRNYEKFQPQNIEKIQQAQQRAREFLLIHRLFKSHRTGHVVRADFTRFSFPPRWYYDILRALDYFRECQAEKDARLSDAIDIVLKRQTREGTWLLQNRHPGRTFFEMEQVGEPSRWNTLRALRILKWWLGDQAIGKSGN